MNTTTNQAISAALASINALSFMQGEPATATAEAPAKQKAKFSVKPANSPARADWGILSDALGLANHAKPSEGASEEKAGQELKALLMRCVNTRTTYRAILMKCAGGIISGYMRNQGADFEGIMSFIESRVWNRNRAGLFTISKTGHEFSTNSIIQKWNPATGGIVGYLSINIRSILARDWVKHNAFDSRFTSLDAMQANGFDIDDTGHVFSGTSTQCDDDWAENFQEQSETCSFAW